MASVTPPRASGDHPDRDLDCQMAAEAAFQELIEKIASAGWGAEETALAVLALAENHVFALLANAETDAAIRHANGEP